MEFKHTTLSNGLVVVAEVNTAALSGAMGFFVRTGSRDETPQINGVSHFLEHMLFKGTDELSALEVNEAFDRTGAKFNAFTSEENTVYYAAVLPEYVLEVMYKDMPQFDVMDTCKALYFADHPCARSVLGTEETIGALTAEQMRRYFFSRYAPNNMVLACCGNVDFDAVCELADKKCSAWQPADTPRRISFCRGSGKKQRQPRENLVREHICIMTPAVSMQDERRFAMSLLATIVGDDTGSRYFWAMVDTAIAETAAMQFDSMDGVGVLYSYFRCSPENAARVLDITGSIFEDLAVEGVTEEELAKAKNKLLSALTIKSEQPMGRLINLGFNWVYTRQYRSVADDVAAVKAVTVADVNALIAEFDLRQFTSFSIGPSSTG